MTELSLILSLDFAVVLLIAALTRWVFAHDSESGEAHSLVVAIRGAMGSFRVRQGKRGAIVAVCVVAATVLLARFYSDWRDATGYAVAGVVFGLLLIALVDQGALGFGVRAATATASALRGPSSSTVILPLRAGAVLALGTEVFVSIVMAAALVVLNLARGGDDDWLLAARVMFSGAALGSVGGAIVGQFSGAATAAAGEFGRQELREDGRQPRFQLNPQNPTMVLSAVGPHMGPIVSRAQDIACLSVLSHVTIIAVTLAASDQANGVNPLVLISLPLLVRTCGLVASAFAALSLRADDGDDPMSMAFRGQLAASVMCAAGMAGACRWLLGPEGWLSAFGVCLLGLLAHVVLAMATRLYSERRSRLINSMREASAAGPEATVTLGLSFGGLLTVATLLCLAGVLALTWTLGSTLGFGGGVAIGVGLCLSGFLATIAFSLTLGSADPLMESACGLASLYREGTQPQTRARLSALDFVAVGSRSMSHTHMTSACALLALVLALVLGSTWTGESALSPPMIATATFVGAAFILSTASLALRHTSLTLAGSSAESLRQLRAFPRNDHGAVSVPKDFSPSYRDQLERVFDAALQRIGLPIFVCLILPLLIGALVRSWLGEEQLLVGLVCFLTMCAITSLALSSVATTTGSLLCGARRHSRPSNSFREWSLARGELFAHALGTSVGSTSRFALIGATASCLVLMAMVL